jgi:predicted transcriptional regulator
MRLTGYSLGCNSERQIEQLRYLKIPYAVISKAGYPPFLFKIPKSPVKRHISNGEVAEIVKSRFANLSATPSQGPQRVKINLSYQPDYGIRQEPKPKTLKDYLKDIKSFLEQVKNNLQLNITKLYESLKLSGRKGDKLKGQLLENGLIEEEILRTGERKRPSKTLKLTAKGERIFSWLKQKVKGA